MIKNNTEKKVARTGKPLGLYFDEDITDKMRYVAWYGRTSLTDLITDAMTTTIKAFEKKNGPITTEQLKEVEKKKAKAKK